MPILPPVSPDDAAILRALGEWRLALEADPKFPPRFSPCELDRVLYLARRGAALEFERQNAG